jgi:hypothetical protein
LLRQYQASVKLEGTRTEGREPRYIQVDDDFDYHAERAKLVTNIRKYPTEYGLPSRPNESAIQDALHASPEYAELQRKWKESHGRNPYTRDESILKAREEKHLADIEVEVLKRTLEAYRILVDIMK